MATVSGLGTTFNLPNYHGELTSVTRSDTPLLSLSGGLSGGQKTDGTTFEWQTEDGREPTVPARLEGANAPTAESRSRTNLSNHVQIFHETVETSYTKQAARGQYANGNAGGDNPVVDEHVHQVANALKTIARDVNYTFWHGRKHTPANNGEARQMAGLLSVVTANRIAANEVSGSTATDTVTATHAFSNGDKVVVTDPGETGIRTDRIYYVVDVSTTVSFKLSETLGGSAITLGTSSTFKVIEAVTELKADNLLDLMQKVYDNGGISEQETATLFCPSVQKRALTKAFASEFGKADPYAGSRSIAGLNVQTIETDFGTLNVVLDRALPPDAIAVVSLEQLAPVFLEIPGKGVLFEEELAKTGAKTGTQIYGEIGLKYGNPLAHGVYRGLLV